MGYDGHDDRARIEAEGAWHELDLPRTIRTRLERTAAVSGDRPAITFQLFSGAKDRAETLTWAELRDRAGQFANLLHRLGLGPEDKVATLLPNCNEAVIAYLGGMSRCVVAPINPMLEPRQIAAILNETGARALVTLRSFPKADVAQKAARALQDAPGVEHVIEVDLNRYMTGPRKLIVPLLRPRLERSDAVRWHRWDKALRDMPAAPEFPDPGGDRVCANFHTGGTTGMPKVAQHRVEGTLYNGWIGDRLLFTDQDNIMCPLPMFHVFAAVVMVGSALCSGAHVVLPTPQGYRGAGVLDNFWKLCERHDITFMIAVPTAISALMQRKVDADISSLQLAFSGSAPLPVELYRRFEEAAGVTIAEGYGLTEATCLVSINPPDGTPKIGSVGVPFPHTELRIYHDTEDGPKQCPRDVVGEICVASPGVTPGTTYADSARTRELYFDGRFLRTGDLGRIDADGFLWITGRSKDVIIRGGHNIDPSMIEDALLAHDKVAMAGAIGQPDAHSGELPCAYVELCEGAEVSPEELVAFACERIPERAAWPKRVEVLDELPKTAVGKIFKPDLRRRAIAHVLDHALSEAGIAASVARVEEESRRGLVARIQPGVGADRAAAARVLGSFAVPWDWADEVDEAG
ncbi:acyl-CoA synthetase [Palleronia sediminis]|uniref:Acyl-CoA synthetase n=1 Tax=Palleronia sediminis TaxID=2547833 RepID=A0A4R6A2G4_9RHOB|nr:acyl-CoA synthetase [Palleronia sediminis]TDL74843.1 acyl-CoA synthetase [Palleronia sediminis]